MARSFTIRLHLALALFCGSACARDTASVRGTDTGADSLVARLSTTIGQEDGSDADILARVFSGYRGSRGIFVANGVPAEVRIYDTSGVLVQRIGRPGGGPGEFQHLTWIAPLGDSIAALDARAGRISIFDPAGRFSRAIGIPATEYGGAEWLGVDGEGLAVGISRRADPRQLGVGGMARDSFVVAFLSPTGEARAFSPTIGGAWWQRAEAEGSVRIRMLQSGPRALVSQGDGRLLLSASDSPTALRLHQARWDTVQIEAPRAVSVDAPQPALRAQVIAGMSGEIWVADTVVAQDTLRRWRVLDASGGLRAVLHLPASLRLWAVGDDWLLGRNESPDGVEQVQLWKLEHRP